MPHFAKVFALAVLPLALTSCAELDYHGMDPKAYQEVIYPKTNQVEFNSIYQSFFFIDGRETFDKKTMQELVAFTNHTYPSAVERLVIATMDGYEPNQQYVTRLLRSKGYKKSVMEYVTDPKLSRNEVVVQLDYSYVVGPDCPDWRKASDSNYSNTNMSGFGCSTVTNMGKQIANPRHLLESEHLYVAPDGAISAQAITNYHNGGGASGSSSAASGESSGDSGSSASSSGSATPQ